MSPLDREFIRQKISRAEDYLNEVEEFLKENNEVIGSDIKSRYSLERVFLLLVEELIDINNHFIRMLDAKPIDDLKSSFTALGDMGVLPADFAKKIDPLAGVRNILVHQYEKLDLQLFLKNLRKNIGDFQAYFRHILAFLEKG